MFLKKLGWNPRPLSHEAAVPTINPPSRPTLIKWKSKNGGNFKLLQIFFQQLRFVFLHRGNCQFLDETSPLISVSCWHEKLFETFLTFKSLFRKIDRRKNNENKTLQQKHRNETVSKMPTAEGSIEYLKKQIRQGGNVLASGASTPGRKNELPERQPAYPCTFPDSEKEAPNTLQLFIGNGIIFNLSGLLSVPR